LQARRVANLPSCSFSEAIGRVRRESGLPMLPYLREILRFMIDYEVTFNDVSPHVVFRTPIEELGLASRTFAPLARAGFGWAEMLLYVSAEDLRAINQVGRGSLQILEEALARHEMGLLPS